MEDRSRAEVGEALATVGSRRGVHYVSLIMSEKEGAR